MLPHRKFLTWQRAPVAAIPKKTGQVSASAPGRQLTWELMCGAGEAGSGAQKSIVIFMTQAELDFILQYINWISLLHSCITGFGKYEALFLFNANK